MLDNLHRGIGFVQKPQTFLVPLIQRPELCLFHHQKPINKHKPLSLSQKKQKKKEQLAQIPVCLSGFTAKRSPRESGNTVAELVPFENSETVMVDRGGLLRRVLKKKKRNRVVCRWRLSDKCSPLEFDNGGSEGFGDGDWWEHFFSSELSPDG